MRVVHVVRCAPGRRVSRRLVVAAMPALLLAGACTSSPRRPSLPRPPTGVSRSASPTVGLAASAAVRIGALAGLADGSVLVALPNAHRVVRRDQNGRWSVFAGNSRTGRNGDGGPASLAALDVSGVGVGMATTSDGTVYLVAGDRVREVSPDGVIRTVAGGGARRPTAIGVPTGQLRLEGANDVAVSRSGTVYLTDDDGLIAWRPGGAARLLLATKPGLPLSGRLLKEYRTPRVAFNASAVAVASDDTLYVADFSPKLLVHLSTTGTVLQIWDDYITPGGLTSGPGGVFGADYGQMTVVRITRAGPVALTSPVALPRFRPTSVASTPQGVYAQDPGTVGVSPTPRLVFVDPTGKVRDLPGPPAELVSAPSPAVRLSAPGPFTDGQHVTITVTGFPVSAKVYLSECATPRDVRPTGCGSQLAAEPFALTDNTGTGTTTITLRASTKDGAEPAPTTPRQICSSCVLLATAGIYADRPVVVSYAITPLRFRLAARPDR